MTNTKVSSREKSLPPRQTLFGGKVWKVTEETAIQAALQAGYTQEYIDSFDGDYRQLSMQAYKKISSQNA